MVGKGNVVKNILLISPYFAPRNVIASVRYTKMVKYLARTGEYHFWIICIGLNKGDVRDEILQRDIEEAAEYVTIFSVSIDKKLLKKAKNLIVKKIQRKKKGEKNSSGKMINSAQEKYAYYATQKKYASCEQKSVIGAMKRAFGKVIITANEIYDLGFEIIFAIKGIKFAEQIPIDDIDVMVSTYGSVGSLLLGLKFKRRRKQLKWIVDYRDVVNANTASKIKYWYLERIAYQADKKAAYITGAGSACVGSGKFLKKCRKIYNGFDKEDIRDFPIPEHNKKFQIVYTGTLYYGKSDMTLLFKMISELIRQKLVDIDRIEVVYAGRHFYILEDQAKKYNLQNILINKNMVSRKEALQLQQGANLLCALTWSNECDESVLTGKVLEYFMMGKPVIAFVIENSPERKWIIEEANLGYCLDVVESGEHYERVKQWFLECYREYIEKGYNESHANTRILDKYSSEKMADRFKQLIDRCCK